MGFTLGDIDRSDEDWAFDGLELRMLHADGSSDTRDLSSPDTELRNFLRAAWDSNAERRAARLLPEQQVTYRQFSDESQCRCGGSCSGDICWYDMLDREAWLDEHSPGGVMVDWRWTAETGNTGPSGSAFLTDYDTRGGEDPGIDHDILGAIDVV